MAIKAVLFDLDGTLLPMEQEFFIKAYFSGIAGSVMHLGFEPKELIGAIWAGTGAMIKNNGSMLNEQAFWLAFKKMYEGKREIDPACFDDFYENDFDKIKEVCGYNPKALQVVSFLKEKGVRLVLATNPIFPEIATRKRISWAGLDFEDFEVVTTYENIGTSKPNPEYYKEILRRIGLNAEDCLMVGNDVGDDMVAESLGMQVFLLTDCLINKDGADISLYPNGSFDELISYIQAHV